MIQTPNEDPGAVAVSIPPLSLSVHHSAAHLPCSVSVHAHSYPLIQALSCPFYSQETKA